MHRTSELITVCAALFALASCAGGAATSAGGAKGNAALTSPSLADTAAARSPHAETTLSGAVQSSQETATLANITPVPERMARLLRPVEAPVFGTLPPLPLGALPGRLPSAVEQRERLGSESYAVGPGASDNGTGKVLEAAAGGVSWAIYQFANIGEYDTLQTLRVFASAPHFTGVPPGFWIGVSDYQRGSWVTLGQEPTLQFERALGYARPYRNTNGDVYVFVLMADGQGVQVDSVEFSVDVPVWVEAEVDAGPDAGYSSALVFGETGNPIIAYATLTDGIPRLAVGDRSAEWRDAANWLITPINPAPEGGGVWTDVVLDPQTGYPVVSLDYIGLSNVNPAENSHVGFSPMVDTGGDPFFLNYVFGGFVDVAVNSSIDKKPGGNDWGIAVCALNVNSPSTDDDSDMQIREFSFDPLNWGGSLNATTTHGFGSNWNFPHLRYNPQSGDMTVCVAGGTVFTGTTPADLVANQIFSEVNSTSLGSVAYSLTSPPLLGLTFQWIDSALRKMTFVEFDESLFGTREMVDSINSTLPQQIGTCSQVAAWDGGWGVAYTRNDTDGVHVKYAFRLTADTDWTVEEVSTTPSVPTNPNNLVFLDLAYDSTGVAGICWNQVDGDKTSLHFALRGAH